MNWGEIKRILKGIPDDTEVLVANAWGYSDGSKSEASSVDSIEIEEHPKGKMIRIEAFTHDYGQDD